MNIEMRKRMNTQDNPKNQIHFNTSHLLTKIDRLLTMNRIVATHIHLLHAPGFLVSDHHLNRRYSIDNVQCRFHS